MSIKRNKYYNKWGEIMNTEKLTYNVSEAAIRLGVSLPSLYQAIRKGEVPVIRIGHRILIPISALEAKLLATAGSKS
jgi:excisionase family DNA binding protein